jgi:succinate-semialdehyde dehydrogenase/glutarate-semialdehyde dehydrogenase
MDSMLIAGAWSGSSDGGLRPVRNPATGAELAQLAYGGPSEAVAACDAAAAAFGPWSRVGPADRAALLQRTADNLADRADEIGALLAAETGKRRPEGVAEIEFAAAYFRWFAEEARRPHGEMLAGRRPGERQFTISRPAGVAVCLSPWNFPVSIQARKLAPALAAGCTAVSRASEQAPLAVIEMFRCLVDAGVPDGVVNLVLGPAAAQTDAMLTHPAVRVVSFTGSTEVGRALLARAGERVVRPLMELGGDAPFVVLDDADVAAAVDGAMIAKFRNNGQSCIAANRFIVQRRIYDDFCRQLAERVNAMSLGDPLDDPVPDLGPLINQRRVDEVTAIAAEAEAAGARRITAAIAAPSGGSFCAPALYDQVPPDARLARSEAFGPIAGVFPVDSDDDALALANDTEMGLAAYVYTRDVGRAWRFTEELDAGIIGCNNPLPSAAHAPMGGVKQSGLGREGAHAGLEEFRETHYASWAL